MLVIMAWRNLWRNRRRTLLTVAAISLGLAVLITMVSFTEGFIDMFVDQLARSSMGHIQLHHPEYRERQSTQLVIPSASRVLEATESTPGVKAASPRLMFSGSIRSSLSSTVRVVRVLAVDPERERHFSALPDKLVAGGFVVPPPEALEPDAPERFRQRKGILLGAKLARQLKVEIGSRVRLDCAGFQGATVALAFVVTGIIQTDTDAFDSQMVMVALKDFQAATGADDTVHEISVMVHDSRAIAPVVDDIRQRIAAQGLDSTEVLAWYDVSPEIAQMFAMVDSWNGLLYLLMLTILSAGILTTLFMVVFERQREFGVQLALGARGRSLFAGIMCEALFIGLLATAIGLAVGGTCVAYLTLWGLDLSFIVDGFEFNGMFIENVYKGSASLKVFVEPTVVVLVGILLFALWPAVRVARMKALAAIRCENV